MQTFLAILSVLLLALGAMFAALNWACIAASHRFHRRGVKRHVSTIPLVPQLCVLTAAIISSHLVHPLLPAWSLWAVAVLEPSLFQVAYYPVFLLRRRLHART